MSADQTIAQLKSGLALVEALTPLAAGIPGAAGNVANIAAELAQIGQAALTAYEGLKIDDLTALSDLTIALQKRNDALAGQIAES